MFGLVIKLASREGEGFCSLVHRSVTLVRRRDDEKKCRSHGIVCRYERPSQLLSE